MKTKIKVLHIIKSLNLGGAETNLFNLVQSLDKNKIELHVAYSQGGEIEGRFLKSGIKLLKFASDDHKIKSLASLSIITRLAAYIKSNKIDIVHTHVFNGQIWGGLAAKIAGAKVIEHVHDFRYLDLDEFQRRRGTTTQYKYSKYFQWLSDASVVLTQQNVDYLLENGFQDTTKIHQIRNGIPLVAARLSSDKQAELKSGFGIPQDAFLISTLSRMSPEKNIDLILRIAPMVNKQVPSAVFVIAGNGPLLDDFKKQVDQSQLGYIKLIGYYDKVRDLLAISDLFLLPSFLELHSIALLEAMSMGVPLITSQDVGCNNDFISHKKNGFLLDPFQDDGWADTIVDLSKNSALRHDVGQAAKATCEHEFDIAITATKFERLYEHILH
jgi:glycosyltransferase involved in cell wall biosynthesis